MWLEFWYMYLFYSHDNLCEIWQHCDILSSWNFFRDGFYENCVTTILLVCCGYTLDVFL